MSEQFSRTERIFGAASTDVLRRSRVLIFGIGGVGGYAVEVLARSGVGYLELVDHDKVALSNLNRQIIATHDTIGMYKVDVAAQRIHSICPEIAVNARRCFYLPETEEVFDFSAFDFVIDAIDTVSAKIDIISQAVAAGVPVISAMGAGNKTDPASFSVVDLSETSVCPLARVMRRELKKRGILHIPVVYSQQMPVVPQTIAADAPNGPESESEKNGKTPPGSLPYVPAAAGIILGGYVVSELIKGHREGKQTGEPWDISS